MVVKKYETEVELKELKVIIKQNQLRLCSPPEGGGVNENYKPLLSNAVIGYVHFGDSDNIVNGLIVGRTHYKKANLELVCAKRGLGIGKMLIGLVTNWFKQHGYETIDLSPADDTLVQYYENMGFTCSKLRDFGTFQEVVCMTKKITGNSDALPKGCGDLKKYSKNDLNSYYANELKDFVNKCSLFNTKVTTKTAAIKEIQNAILKYKC